METKGNMTEGKILPIVVMFTLPIMAGYFLQQLYNTVDGIVVGQFIGESALASVGTCAPLTVFYVAFAMGMSNGGSIIVAQYFGADRKTELKKAVSTALILLTAIGIFFSLFGGLVAAPVLKNILAVPKAQLADATSYFKIYCYGLIFQFIYNAVAAVLRALGDSKATLYFLLISSGINIGLDLLFIIVFKMGVPGAALATIIAQGISALVSVIYMFARYPQLRFTKETFVFDPQMCSLIFKYGVPSTVQQCIVSCGHIAMQRLVNSFGASFMSGYTAGTRLESYLVIPALGFMVGMSTFTGQNIGAGKIDRVKEGLHKITKVTGLSTAVLSLIAFVFASSLVGFFGVEGEALEMGTEYLRLIAPFFIIFSVYQAFVGLLQGSGDVSFCAFCTLTSLGLRVIISYSLAGTAISFRALCISSPIAWVYVLILCLWRYKRGKWTQKGVQK
ncbi:MAG: MATE family efflux transporter [Eubacterium sp.]|nr:MATE family efflux transporter [Eubacterium sp.]